MDQGLAGADGSATKNPAERVSSTAITRAPKRPFVPPVFLVNAALRLRRFFLRAADAVVPAYVALVDRFMGAEVTMLIHSVARLRIPDLLADGPLTAAELAQRTDSDAHTLERTLVALVSLGVFRREGDGRCGAGNAMSSGNSPSGGEVSPQLAVSAAAVNIRCDQRQTCALSRRESVLLN